MGGEKTRVFAKLSRGAKAREIDEYLLGRIRKTLGLETNEQAQQLLQCKMSAEDYVRILRATMRI